MPIVFPDDLSLAEAVDLLGRLRNLETEQQAEDAIRAALAEGQFHARGTTEHAARFGAPVAAQLEAGGTVGSPLREWNSRVLIPAHVFADAEIQRGRGRVIFREPGLPEVIFLDVKLPRAGVERLVAASPASPEQDAVTRWVCAELDAGRAVKDDKGTGELCSTAVKFAVTRTMLREAKRQHPSYSGPGRKPKSRQN